jgi:hypothetical protein
MLINQKPAMKSDCEKWPVVLWMGNFMCMDLCWSVNRFNYFVMAPLDLTVIIERVNFSVFRFHQNIDCLADC